MSTLTLHATGSGDPVAVWERYAVPARWVEWSPQITGVDLDAPRLMTGVAGRVRGPLRLAVPFTVDFVDEPARTWSWTVTLGPARIRMRHWVTEAPDGGTTTGLRMTGPLPLVTGYAPLARVALGRLVG